MTRLESHPCSLRLVAPKVSTNNHKLPAIPNTPAGAPRDVREHTLRVDDPLLNAILDLLETFFINPVDTNLSVTETVVDLAICGYMSIGGWLARNPKSYAYAEDEASDGALADETSTASEALDSPITAVHGSQGPSDVEAQRLKDLEQCRRRPMWSQESVPRILRVLKSLCDQVASYKETVPRFEDLLQQRREAFQTADTMLDSPVATRKASLPSQGTPERPSLDEVLRAGSPSRPSALEGFAQRLLSELGTPSRSGSPRGRKEQRRGSGTSTPGNASGAPELLTPKAIRVPPKEFPINYIDAGRSGNTRSLSRGSAGSEAGAAIAERDPVAASQASAFAAIDQSILAKRVGLPDETLKPIPLRLERTATSEHDESSAESVEETKRTGDGEKADTSQDAAGPANEAGTETPTEKTKVSVSHIITNVIIFQSFLLELAGLMQVRAGLFGEVRYV